jgi:hypothetical protein
VRPLSRYQGRTRLERSACGCQLAACPDRAERPGEPLRLDAVRRVEVVPLVKHLEREVRENFPEPCGNLAELVRVAETAEREVDRTLEGGQGVAVQVVGF